MKMFIVSAILCSVVFNAVTIDAASKLENDIVKTHNHYRDLHGVPHVSLSKKLSKYAQEWADDIAARDALEHRPNNPYGENIYATGGDHVDGFRVVESFYDEINDYDFAHPGFYYETGHFTQAVWRESKKIGVGIAKGSYWTYVVVNYDPPGNYPGGYEENVPEPL